MESGWDGMGRAGRRAPPQAVDLSADRSPAATGRGRRPQGQGPPRRADANAPGPPVPRPASRVRRGNRFTPPPSEDRADLAFPSPTRGPRRPPCSAQKWPRTLFLARTKQRGRSATSQSAAASHARRRRVRPPRGTRGQTPSSGASRGESFLPFAATVPLTITSHARGFVIINDFKAHLRAT